MQRRAAAAYAAFFVIVAVGSYAFVGAAEEPAIVLENPEVTATEGDTFTVDGVEYTVDNLSEPQTGGEGIEGGEGGGGGDAALPPVEAVLVSTTDGNETRRTIGEGDRLNLSGTTYVVHFPDRTTLQLTTDVEAYQQEFEDQQRFHQRIRGINYVAVLSLIAAVILVATAYLPRRR